MLVGRVHEVLGITSLQAVEFNSHPTELGLHSVTCF